MVTLADPAVLAEAAVEILALAAEAQVLQAKVTTAVPLVQTLAQAQAEAAVRVLRVI